MKQFIFSLSALLMTFFSTAQVGPGPAGVGTPNFIPSIAPALNPSAGPVVFGLLAPVADAPDFQIHGVDDYCIGAASGGPELPAGVGAAVDGCYGRTAIFKMTNPVTGTGLQDGAMLRMSELNFVVENREGKLLDIKTGGAMFRLDGPASRAWFGAPSTGHAASHVSSVNILSKPNANGLLVKTFGNNSVGLTVKGGSDNIAMQVVEGISGPKNFVVQSNGFVFARKYTTTLANIPDYVFKPDYNLMPLFDLRNYITTNQHLPNIPSAAEYEETGVDLGELNRLLLEKVEELTLYILQQDERLRKLEASKY